MRVAYYLLCFSAFIIVDEVPNLELNCSSNQALEINRLTDAYSCDVFLTRISSKTDAYPVKLHRIYICIYLPFVNIIRIK